MNFLQPWMLLALPVVALPILIHLINQRRYQTMPWAAMMFLLAANRMSRGYARIRQWLILALRMLVIAALLFVISRPLASGWLGAAAGGSADTTLVLLDRSPSMQQIGAGTARSKLAAGREQLVRTLSALGSTRVVLIDSGDRGVRELASIEELADAPDTQAAGNTADLPAMLQQAQDYVRANRVGRADVWIVSDLRQSDWDANSGRWASIRESFQELPQTVKFHLLAYPQPAAENRAIQVTGVRRQKREHQTQLLISLRVTGGAATESAAAESELPNASQRQLPLQFEIAGARSQFNVPLSGGTVELKDHAIAIEDSLQRGWGRVSLPADPNPADNVAYFVFDDPPPRKTILIAEDAEAARPLKLAAEISSEPNVVSSAEQVPREQLGTVPWEEVSLLLWQGALPTGEEQQAVDAFVQAGGQAIFFPPRTITPAQSWGVRWLPWKQAEQGLAVAHWRGDQDLLSATISGASLPVGQLRIERYAGLEGDFTPLATLDGDQPLLVRGNHASDEPAAASAVARAPGVYFCTTTPSATDSSLARDGVVLYVAIQRAVLRGAAALSSARAIAAGAVKAEDWRVVAGADEAISSEYGIQQGVYQTQEQLLAVHRSAAEDDPTILPDAQLQGLFQGLDFSRIDDTTGNLGSLVHEIWRLFLVLMIVAMIAEAALSLPRRRTIVGGVTV